MTSSYHLKIHIDRISRNSKKACERDSDQSIPIRKTDNGNGNPIFLEGQHGVL
jgi:hypothetical protein